MDKAPSRTPRPQSQPKPRAASEGAARRQTAALPVQISCRWDSSARRALQTLDADLTVRALNGAARAALRATFAAAPPLLGALRTHLDELKAPLLSVDLALVDDAEIRDLNAQFRGKNKPTDVLSFPLWEDEEENFFPLEMAREQSEQVALGDLVISIETAARQARDLKHDLRAEIAFLSVHGALHLMGYDHGDGSARRRMFAMQDQIFERVRGEKGF